MLRAFICAAVAVVLATGLTLAADKKAVTYTGAIKKVDAKEGTLTVAVKVKKKETMDKDFKVADDTKVVVIIGEETKEAKGKDGLKNEAFKEGAAVSVTTDADGKVTQVQIKKKK